MRRERIRKEQPSLREAAAYQDRSQSRFGRNEVQHECLLICCQYDGGAGQVLPNITALHTSGKTLTWWFLWISLLFFLFTLLTSLIVHHFPSPSLFFSPYFITSQFRRCLPQNSWCNQDGLTWSLKCRILHYGHNSLAVLKGCSQFESSFHLSLGSWGVPRPFTWNTSIWRFPGGILFRSPNINWLLSVRMSSSPTVSYSTSGCPSISPPIL